VKIHPFRYVGAWWLRAFRSVNVKIIIYGVYVIVNGVTLHLAGKTFAFPLKRTRYESFQTVRSMRRALRKAGFKNIDVRKGRSFIATAVR
jgi:hypothetical protein